MDKYECLMCGWIYDPEKGDPDGGIRPGTPFEKIPDNWTELVVEQDSITVKLEQPEFFLSDTPTVELVLEACKYYKIQYPDIVTAQSILETGYYKSKGCLERHNLFGLYNSYKKDYYTFNHWTESVKAYYDFVQYRYKEGDYYDWLEKIGYAEDPLYLTKVKQVKAKNNL
jgi:rubredoxin